MAKNPAKYFIVEQDDLAKYGNAEGMTKEECEKALDELSDPDGSINMGYCIIKGVQIRPKYRL